MPCAVPSSTPEDFKEVRRQQRPFGRLRLRTPAAYCGHHLTELPFCGRTSKVCARRFRLIAAMRRFKVALVRRWAQSTKYRQAASTSAGSDFRA
jgi:hypothetical protein